MALATTRAARMAGRDTGANVSVAIFDLAAHEHLLHIFSM